MEPTKAELEAIPSIWDGWEKQCRDYEIRGDGAACATDYVQLRYRSGPGSAQSIERVADYIRKHYDVPRDYRQSRTKELFYPQTWPSHALIYANDVLEWTPDDFRHVDRLTQWQAMQKQVDAIPVPEVTHAN